VHPVTLKKVAFIIYGYVKNRYAKLKDGRLHVKLQNFSRILSAEERVKYRYPKLKTKSSFCPS
jgi:hypothetical protein